MAHTDSDRTVRSLPGGRRFSLLEIVVVLAVLSLILAIVLPRVARVPARLTVENAHSRIRSALREAGLRARASGRPLRLVLDAEENTFRVLPLPAPEDLRGEPPPADDDGARNPGVVVRKLSRYDMPGSIAWHPETALLRTEDEAPFFAFFPDGEASGTPVEFTVAKRRYVLDVERLTGHPVIRSFE